MMLIKYCLLISFIMLWIDLSNCEQTILEKGRDAIKKVAKPVISLKNAFKHAIINPRKKELKLKTKKEIQAQILEKAIKELESRPDFAELYRMPPGNEAMKKAEAIANNRNVTKAFSELEQADPNVVRAVIKKKMCNNKNVLLKDTQINLLKEAEVSKTHQLPCKSIFNMHAILAKDPQYEKLEMFFHHLNQVRRSSGSPTASDEITDEFVPCLFTADNRMSAVGSKLLILLFVNADELAPDNLLNVNLNAIYVEVFPIDHQYNELRRIPACYDQAGLRFLKESEKYLKSSYPKQECSATVLYTLMDRFRLRSGTPARFETCGPYGVMNLVRVFMSQLPKSSNNDEEEALNKQFHEIYSKIDALDYEILNKRESDQTD